MSLDYKSKYRELKSKMIEATDLAYRLGMEEGMKQGQQQAQQAQMQQMQQMMMQPQIGPDGQPIPGGQPGGAPGAMPPGAAAPMDPNALPPEAMGAEMDPNALPPEAMMEGQGDELDQYINELESLVAKGEKPSVIDMRKKVEQLTALRKSQKEKAKKLKQNQPQVATAQKKFVDGILSKWEKETKVTSETLEDVLKDTGLKIE